MNNSAASFPGLPATGFHAARHLPLLVLLALLAMGTASQLRAADGPPPLMSFQTRVLDAGGAPINGARDVVFRIFGSESGGAALWSEKQSVTAKDGYISVILGQGGPVPGEVNLNGSLAALFPGINDAERFIEIEVASIRISPRLRMLPTAYSFVSSVALKVIGNSIETAMMRDASVISAKIADGAVNSAKIADGSVLSIDLAGDAVNSSKIQDGQVGTSDLADGAVSSAKILDGAVGTSDLAGNAVNSSKILDGEVGSGDLANSAVTSGKIADGAVTNAKLGANAVTGDKVSDGTLGQAKLAGAIFKSRRYYKPGGGYFNTGESYFDWYPLISGFDLGDGDLQEDGTGSLGGVWTYQDGVTGTWWVGSWVRTHINPSDPTIRILWIPRRLVDFNDNNINK